ncbi:MAG TPA: NHL repeat-containing protein, partial [Burkholderiaceae bacterium]|nr:NHL repeat-containing protein [Burkholderiaceae bacterium]
VYVADNNTIRKITPAGVVSTLAASPLVYGNVDGTDALARLRGVTTDSAGNVYVVDSGNNLIRKITPTGVVTTIAGLGSVSGYADATGSAAGFNAPDGIGTDSQGNIYVADIVNSTIRKITPAGVVSTFAGKAGVRGSADGTGSAASFNNPTGVATDVSGNVYVADATNSTVRKITPAGVVTTLAGTAGVPGIADGTGPAAQFGSLSGVVTDAAGNVFVADQQTIRKITPGGVVTTLAGQQTPGISGSADGVGAAARFGGITGIATDAAGNIYVTDTQNHTIRKVTQAGVVTTLAGTAGAYGTADGTGPAATFTYPEGITVDGKGNLYVFDSDGISAAGDSGNRIRKITPAGVVTTIVGAPGKLGFASGTLPGSLPTPLYVSNVAISGTSLYITAANGIAVVTNVP